MGGRVSCVVNSEYGDCGGRRLQIWPICETVSLFYFGCSEADSFLLPFFILLLLFYHRASCFVVCRFAQKIKLPCKVWHLSFPFISSTDEITEPNNIYLR